MMDVRPTMYCIGILGEHLEVIKWDFDSHALFVWNKDR